MGKPSMGPTETSLAAAARANEAAIRQRELFDRLLPGLENIISRGEQFLGMPAFGGSGPRTIPGESTTITPSEGIELTDAQREIQIQNISEQTGLRPDQIRAVYDPRVLYAQPGGSMPITITGEPTTIPGTPQANVFSTDPSASPLFAPGKHAVERQFRNARESALATLPQGGSLADVMGDIEVGRASSLAGLEAAISEDFFNKIFGVMSGAPQQSLAGLTGTAGILGQIGGSQAAANAQASAGQNAMYGNLGMGLGSMLGGAMGAGGKLAT